MPEVPTSIVGRNQQALATLEARRTRAAKLLRQGRSQSDVARELEVSRQAVSKWARALDDDGARGLRSRGPLGPPREIDRDQLARVLGIVFAWAQKDGIVPNAWTAPRVAELIKVCFGVEYDPAHVWKLLRSFGWRKRGWPHMKGRNEMLRAWMKRRWPRLKKKLRL